MTNPEAAGIPCADIHRVDDAVVIRHKTGSIVNICSRARSSLVLTESGAIEYLFDGRRVLSDASCVLFLPKGATYRLHCITTGVWYMVNFEGTLAEDMPFCIEVDSSTALYDCFFAILKSSSQYKKMSLFYELLDRMENGNDALLVPDIIKPQIAYLKHHFGDPAITNASLAAMTNISEVYFRRLFTSAVGMPPMRYLRWTRVENAKRCLRERARSVEEIARLCGYGSLYYFSAAFKKETGLSPTGYARLNDTL